MPNKKPLTVPEYERMANDLQVMSDTIRAIPAMNHNFAERLEILSKEMRADEARAHPEIVR